MADAELLDEVRQAAEAALGAHASGESTEEADGRKLTAARAALDGGHPIAAIAAAETEGEIAARGRVGGMTAARAALDGGHPIAAIAAAETEGEIAARGRVGGQVLRSIERLAKKMRDSIEEYERAVALATKLGLSARDIAAKAEVSHGTVAAVARRREQAETAPPVTAVPETSDVEHAGEPAPGTRSG